MRYHDFTVKNKGDRLWRVVTDIRDYGNRSHTEDFSPESLFIYEQVPGVDPTELFGDRPHTRTVAGYVHFGQYGEVWAPGDFTLNNGAFFSGEFINWRYQIFLAPPGAELVRIAIRNGFQVDAKIFVVAPDETADPVLLTPIRPIG